MTGTDHAIDGRGCGADVAAFALGALEPDETQVFRAHLKTCAVCRDELDVLGQVVGVLPMAAPQYPAPRKLRRRVLRAVADSRAPSRSESGRRLPRLGGQLRPALALSGVLAVIAIAIGALELGPGGTPTSRNFAADVSGSPGGSAELKVTGGHGELVLHHFSPPPAGEIYEVWLTRGSQPPQPTDALFSISADGEADVDVPGALRGIASVMVTPEPDGGTRSPTHPAVIRVRLA